MAELTDEQLFEIGTERINMLLDFVASVHNLTYNEVADKLGINRGWFTRYRNGGFDKWGASAVFGVVHMLFETSPEMVFDWLTAEDIKRA